jgi:hypothetical protein
MFQYALVAENGEVQHVVSSGSDSDYIEGQVYNNLTAVQVSFDADAQGLIETKYYVDGKWHDRSYRATEWDDWTDNAWVFNAARFSTHVRLERNNKISVTDWTQSSDSPLTETKKSEWASYRQLLRDIPATYSDATSIDDITWPTQPEN